jgi:hypothetical protein
MNEAETRAEHIDPSLKAAGWGVVEGSRIRREVITPGRIEGKGRRGKGLAADYVLVHRNTKLAVLEAKAWDKPLTEGVAQAKDYAAKLQVRFAYSTNGQGSTVSTWKPATRAAGRLPDAGRTLGATFASRTSGATASPRCPSRTRAAPGTFATTRTSPSTACWRPSWPAATASC